MCIPHASLEAYQLRSQFFYSIILRSSSKYLLGWESVETQTDRFRIFVEEYPKLLPKTSVVSSFSLLDAGCGYGACYAYLKQREIACDYTGMDYSHECLNEARAFYDADATFFQANLFEPMCEVGHWGMYDLCFISGVLNLNIDAIVHKGATYEVMLFVMEKLLQVSRYGIIFNVLHVKSPAHDDMFFYHDPEHLSGVLENNGMRVFGIRNDYLPNDMTVLVQRDET